MGFGVYIATYPGDWHLAKGCVASIREYCGDVPICLIVDGHLNLNQFAARYNLQTMRREDISNDFLRARSFGGFGYSHFIPFFEGPFDEFFYVDADAVLLGDLLSLRAGTKAEMVTPFEFGIVDDAGLTSANWFRSDFMERTFPGYQWRRRAYFFAGTFFGRRGILDIEEYGRLLDMQRANPTSTFQCGDQGILNYLTFSGLDGGRFSHCSVDFQWLAGDVERLHPGELARWSPRKPTSAVLHYAHTKPVVDLVRPLACALGLQTAERSVSRPMNHFRKCATESLSRGREFSLTTALAMEDLWVVTGKVRKAIRRRLAA